jgi:N,N'-diacetyllegionaminate synthase
LVAAGTPRKNISILHCTSDYPAKFEDLNLKAIQNIADALDCKVGYSDHSVGTEVSIAAVALGAVIIEKHFTLDHNMEGPDHRASLEPEELKQMIDNIRNIEQALGDGIKTARGGEIPTRVIARRSIHALHDIPAGTTITPEMLIMKRPGNGLSPYDANMVLGKKSIRKIGADDMIQEEDLE